MKKVVWTNTLVAAVALTVSAAAPAAGDVNAGKAKAAVCGACHGMTGEGNPAFPDPMNPGKTKAVPSLAGQNAGYMVKQLQDFKSGTRKDVLMTGQAMGLSDADMANLGAYYATVSGKAGGATDAALVAKGKALYQGGDMARGISACMACHGPDAAGNDLARWPALSGQLGSYTTAQLHAFSSGARVNDPNGMMRDVAAVLKEGDIAAITAYLGSLGAPAAKTAVATVAPAPAAAAPAAAAQSAAVPAAGGAADGATLFQGSCFACHGPAAPALNAPQSGVKANWEPRLQKAGGVEGLVKSAVAGVAGTAMAPRGGSSLNDAELQSAIEYMLSQSGL
jgi:cytochrome c553